MASVFRIEGAFLRSRLAKRIFLMFCIAVIVPTAVVLWLTYRTAAAGAQQAGQAAMRAETRNFALTVFDRLQSAHAMLDRVDVASLEPAGEQALLAPFFQEIALLHPAGDASGTDAGWQARLLRQPRIQWGTTALAVLPAEAQGQTPDIVLLGTRGVGPGGVIAGRVRASYLWGEPEDIAVGGEICANAGALRLTCVGEAPSGVDQMRDEWELFLNARFGAEPWHFSARRDAEPLLARHLWFLAPLAIGLLLLVLLLSSIEIRRVMVPLESLLARIRSMGAPATAEAEAGDGDEFATLGRTFGQMEQRIHRQMDTLRTLAQIDRMILDRVPLATVVDVVVARIHVLAGIAAVGVTLEDPQREQRDLHFLRARGQDQTLSGVDPALAPMPGSITASQRSPGQWTTHDVAGPGFQRHGARRTLLLALGHREGAHAWLALGLASHALPDEDVLDEVRELAERIAVAVAVEEHENLLVFQARHDPLTGLANRLATLEALTEAIGASARTGQGFSAAFIDLDRFKSINDGLGHGLGDLILIKTAERIRQCVMPGDFVARFGGDEFFVILRSERTPSGAARALARLRAAFEMPIVADGIELVVGFCAGVVLHPRHGADAQQLIHNADVAMYRGKKAGGGRIEFFEEEMNENALTRVQLENDLRLAIRAGMIEVHYQPRVDSRSGRIVGVEALARWNHPEKGGIPPGTFITVAEECGLIEELGNQVLDEACRQLAAWRAQGLALPLMAVNVSGHQLRSGTFAETVARAVARSGIAWHQLELEVTESLLVNDSGAAARQLQAIRDAGATVAIDDFGTGYSSLAYLTRLPTDTLKIDRAFIATLDGDGAGEAVVRSIVALATALEKHIVAEGVESMAHVRMLNALGCHIIQGYVYFRPLSPQDMTSELTRTLAEDRTSHA
jgi:diguanylate cyclase (GGDEF)-like protein